MNPEDLRVPWREYMKIGMGGMGLTSKEFWSLTMREFWAIYDFKYGHLEPKFSRDDLLELMQGNPD